MKRLLLACLLFGSQNTVSAAEAIKIGFFSLKPHAFVEAGSSRALGASIMLSGELLAEAGYQVEWVGPLPFPRLIEMLQQGKLDGGLPLAKKPEREAFLIYLDKPLLETNPSFTVLATNKLQSINSIEDVRGYRVGFLAGADQGVFLKNNASSMTIELLGGDDWIKQNLNKLLTGRLDAVFDLNPWSIPFEAKAAGVSDKIKVLRLPEPPGYNYLAISKNSPRARELSQKLNTILNKKKFNYQDYVDQISK